MGQADTTNPTQTPLRTTSPFPHYPVLQPSFLFNNVLQGTHVVLPRSQFHSSFNPSFTYPLYKCRSEMRPLMVRRTFPHSKTYRAEKSTILSRSLIPIVHRVIAHLWRRYVTCYLPLYLIHSLFTDRGRTRRPT
jgi:hypothetical protein